MPKAFSPFLKKMFNLRAGAEDKDVIVENIREDVEFSSARIWILVFAVGIASIGLNINSVPLVIGAMLISPLMAPIVSIGMSLAINDWNLMHKSFRNFLTLIVIGIGISTLYFALSPITNAQSELLSRIQPTIFDVLVAVFGGMAGFIGMSRHKQSTVIPGVAIATALMPPLCTIGYGLGTLQFNFVFGALYLFLINAIFICLSSLFISKYLKLPKAHYDNEDIQRRARRIITVIIVVITIPALYFAYTFVQKNNFTINAERYIKSTFEDAGYVVIYKNIEYRHNNHSIELAFLTKRPTAPQVEEFKAKLADFKLEGTELKIRQNSFTLSDEEWQQILINVKNDSQKVRTLEAMIAYEQQILPRSEDILAEMRVLNNMIVNTAIGRVTFADSDNESTESESIMVSIYTDTAGPPISLDDAAMLTQWLKKRLNDEAVVVQFVPPAKDVIEVVVDEVVE